MNPIVLSRKSLIPKEELVIANKFFPVVFQRTEIPKESLVIPRYSALPYYLELQKDIENLGSRLINSYSEHQYIAKFDYYNDLLEYTPKSWTQDSFVYCDYKGPFIVKGATNSKKFHWNKLMFAPTKQDAFNISSELLQDSMIGQQDIIYREYVPLRTFEIGINELPFTNEWRFFFLGEELLSYSYYWTIADKPELANITPEAINFARQIAKSVSHHTNFFVLDIAEKQSGGWILIEINDGSQAGVAEDSTELMYQNLSNILKEEE